MGYEPKTDKQIIEQLEFMDNYEAVYRIKELKKEVANLKRNQFTHAIAANLLRPEKVHAIEIEEAYNEQIVEDKPDFQEMADYINRKE